MEKNVFNILKLLELGNVLEVLVFSAIFSHLFLNYLTTVTRINRVLGLSHYQFAIMVLLNYTT